MSRRDFRAGSRRAGGCSTSRRGIACPFCSGLSALVTLTALFALALLAIAASSAEAQEVFEAEDAVLSGGVTVADNHPGYSGTGFADYPATTGSDDKIRWQVRRDSGADADVSVRYANGGGTDRPLDLVVNGNTGQAVAFPPTGGWANWQTVTVEDVALVAGDNTLELIARSSVGPNVDWLGLLGDTAPSFGRWTVENQTYNVGKPVSLVLPPAEGGDGPLGYSLGDADGRLPDGLSFDAGTREIAGTPTSVQSARSYTYRAFDNDANTEPSDAAELTFTIEVAQARGEPVEGVIPDRSYPSSEVLTRISPQLSDRHHNQPTVVGGYLLLAGNGAHEFWDISDPYSPARVSEMFSPHRFGEAEAHQVSYARFADGGRYLVTPSGRGIDLWDIGDVRHPRLLSAMELPNIHYGDVHNAVWGVAWQGDYIYVGATTNGLYIVDAEDPTQPELVDVVAPAEMGQVAPGPLFALGNLLVIATPKNRAGLVTMDIGDPARPALLDFVKPPGASYIGWLYGRHAYLQEPLRSYDVTTDPRNIRLVGSGTAPRSEYMSFGDGYLFLGGLRGGSQGIWKYDVSDPTDFALAARIPGRDSRWDDQFSIPIGNLVAISDDQNVGGFVGSYLAVHAAERDTQPPAVDYVNPPDGAVDQPLTSRIGLSFSDQVKFTSVDASTLIVRPRGGSPLTGKWGHTQTVVTFWPDQPLAADTTYEIVAAADGITDLVGNGLAREFRSEFRTRSAARRGTGGIGVLSATEVGQSAGFVADPVSAASEYRWDFGDGRGGVGRSVSHRYDNPGRYTVTLSVSEPDIPEATYTAIQIVHRRLTASAPAGSGTVIVAADQTRVWAVNPDADTVTAVDTGTLNKALERRVGETPRTLAQAPDGTIWVVNEGSHDISVLDSGSGAVIDTIGLPYASMPYGIAFAPDGSAAYVTLQALGRLLRLDPATRSIVQSLALGPDARGIVPKPRGIAIDSNSRRILVSRFVSPEHGGEVYDVDVLGHTMSLARTIALAIDAGPDTTDSGRGVPNYISSLAISPDGGDARVPSKKDNIARGLVRDGQRLTHEHTVRTVVSRIDLSRGEEDRAARLDLDEQDMASAVAFSPRGDLLFVVSQGSNVVNVIDAYGHTRVAAIPTGLAPQGLILDDRGRLYVQNFMSRSLSVFDVLVLLNGTGGSARLLAEIDLVANEKLPEEVLRGKRIFYDASAARLSLEGYISCASCHLEGGQDGHTWDFTDRGEGLRNTISLRGRGGVLLHGPLHWTGNFDEVQDFEGVVRSHFGGSGFMSDGAFNSGTRKDPLGDPKAGLSAGLDALAAYVSSLTRVLRSPYRDADGSLTAEGEAGRQVFADAGCADCHGGAGFTDSALGVLHDVGTIRSVSGGRLGRTLPGFDTPTLKGVWATAPYLHDGSASTLAEAISAHRGVRLSDAALGALVSYLRQIDELEPPPPPTILSLPSVANRTFTVGRPVALTLPAASGGDGSYAYALLNADGTPATLASGLSFDADIHTLSGVPEAVRTATTYTYRVTDGAGATTERSFTVTVRGESGGGGGGGGFGFVNRPPVIEQVIPAQTLDVSEAAVFDLGLHFHDPDQSALDYAVASADSAVASVEVEGGALTMRGVGRGRTTLTVSASDRDGLTASQTFKVTVLGPALLGWVPRAADPLRQGFVRVVNRAGEDAEMVIEATDDTGRTASPVTLEVAAGEAVQFNSDDLEAGNPAKGLAEGVGSGEGDWWVVLDAETDFDALAYVRTAGELVTAMHDRAPFEDGAYRVAFFNPGSNAGRMSLLRVVNPGEEAAAVTVTGIDARGVSPGSAVGFTVPAGAALSLNAAELEAGGEGLTGALGDGDGKWRLRVVSDRPLVVMSLLSHRATGDVTNLSTVPAAPGADGVHRVPFFPAAADAPHRQGFVRVVNRAQAEGTVTVSRPSTTAAGATSQ